MTTTISLPDDERDGVESRLRDDETREVPKPPAHIRCPVCMAWNHPAADRCAYCGKLFDGRCPSCGL